MKVHSSHLSLPQNVIEHGQWQWGRYTRPFRSANLLDASPSKPRFWKNLGLREWQAFQVNTPNHFAMIALYNTKKISLVQFILYDKNTKEKHRFEWKVPAWQIHLPEHLFGTRAFYKGRAGSLEVLHDLHTQTLTLKAHLRHKHTTLKAHLEGVHDTTRFTPSVVCLPFSKQRGMYSHKCLMPVSGTLQVKDTTLNISADESLLILDDHKGYYPYPTRYDWVTGLGYLNDKRMFGFNFTDNQVRNPEKYNENVYWIDGQLTPLGPIKVHRPNGYKEKWYIKDRMGLVDLVFTPCTHHSVSLNLGIFKSKYQGPYGYFSGQINDIELNHIFGMGEDFYLKT